MKTIKEILNQYKGTYATPETVDDAKLLKDIKSDYNNIIDLRNRIHDSTDTEPCKMYDEDHIVLDHVLDFMELLITAIKPKRNKYNLLQTYRELYKNKIDAAKLYIAAELDAHNEKYATDKMVECLHYLWVYEYNMPIAELVDGLCYCCQKEYKNNPTLLLKSFNNDYDKFKTKYEKHIDI